MIDTINIELDKTPEINSLDLIVERNYRTDTNNVCNDNVLWTNPEIGNVYGKKAYFFGDRNKFRFHIKKWKDGRLHSIVNCSIPKLLYGNNYNEIKSKEELIEAINILEKELARHGIKTDIKKAKVIRLDLFKNIILNADFSYYKELFHLFDIINCYKEIRDTSYYWNHNNGYWALIIYDKSKEIADKNTINNICPANTARAEIRFLKSKVVENYIHINTINELIDNFYELKKYYNDFIEDKIFWYDVNIANNRIINSSILNQSSFKNLKLKEHDVIKRLGIQFLISTYGKENAINYLLETCNLNGSSLRSKKSRLSKLVSQVDMDSKLISNSKDNCFRLEDLYFELKNKLLDR